MTLRRWLGCFFGHEWTKWSEPEVVRVRHAADVIQGLSITPSVPIHYSITRQRRDCEVCGLTEYREVQDGR